MHDPIKNLSPEQALEVVMCLSEKVGRLREGVLAAGRNVLGEIDLDETAMMFLAMIQQRDARQVFGNSRKPESSVGECRGHGTE
jgi:hypothetical protein